MEFPRFATLLPALSALFLGRKLRRVRLVFAVGLLLSCAVRHVDEAQVRAIVAQRLDCDEQLIELEAEASPDDSIARYDAHGCNKTQEVDCRQNGGVVACESTDKGIATNEVKAPSSDSSYDWSSCNCGHLGGGHSSTPAASPATTSVMPTSQQTDNQRR